MRDTLVNRIRHPLRQASYPTSARVGFREGEFLAGRVQVDRDAVQLADRSLHSKRQTRVSIASIAEYMYLESHLASERMARSIAGEGRRRTGTSYVRESRDR
jgi:hypothetical protein